MKKEHIVRRLGIALLCVLPVLFFIIPVSADADTDEKHELVVGVPCERCPVFYTDGETGQPTGIGVDLMRYVTENCGYSVAFKPIEEANLNQALDNEEYDVLMPFADAITSEHGKSMIVSDSMIDLPFTLVTEGNRKLPDLNVLRVGMPHSLKGASESIRHLYPGIQINMYDDLSDCVDALRKDKVDALLHNSYYWSYVLQKPSYSDLTVQPTKMFSMALRVGTLDTPEGRAVIDRLNLGISRLSDTRRQAVILDYTSRRLYKYDFSDYIYVYGFAIVLAVLLFVILILIAVIRVRSVRKTQEKKMQELIDKDPLTGLYSLNGFRKRVEELLHDNQDTPYMIIYANIKNFKYINDSLGRSAGDELLRFWADTAVKYMTEQDAMCRIEADHFAVLRRLQGDVKINMNENDMVDTVRNYFIDRGKETKVQICGGVYVLTSDDYEQVDVDHMIDCARMAERRVHHSRRDGYEIYNPEQWERGKRTQYIITHLSDAIKSGEIQVWYQPQVNFSTGEITGAEALCRWNHPKLGWISPGEFIPILEEAGSIFELDSFVWERVCQDLQRWNKQKKPQVISVNLSRCDITEERNIPELFINLIKKYELTVEQLRIEITETGYVESPEILISTTSKLRDYGFQVEMDDFGSGYSSLNMLKEVPVDRIKLDLHFLRKSDNPEKSRTIISYVVQMVRSLGMDMIAEGVENSEQSDFLQSKGCIEMQGYYFFKPMSVTDFEKIMDTAGVKVTD